MRTSRRIAVLASVLVVAGMAGCAPPEKQAASGDNAAATATSAADLGGMDALVKAAKKEGKLNVIALPPDWANYGDDHQGVRATSTASRSTPPSPTRASQDEINAANQLKGTDTRARRVRPRPVRGAGQHRDVRAVQGRDLGRHPGRLQGRRRHLGQRLRRLHVDRLRLRKVPDVTGLDDLLEPGVQGQGRAQRRPDPGRRRVQRRDDGLARQRRLGRRHRARRRLLRQAQEGRQLPARRPDPGDHRVRPDAGRHRLGLPERAPRPRSCRRWKVVVPENAVGRRLLLPGDQQGRPAPGGRPAVGGVPLLATRARTSGSAAAPARCAPTRWSRPARSTRRRTTRCRRSTARR